MVKKKKKSFNEDYVARINKIKKEIKNSSDNPKEVEAMLEYWEWFEAHLACEFQGSGELGKDRQKILKKFIKNKEFVEKYDLSVYRFRNKMKNRIKFYL